MTFSRLIERFGSPYCAYQACAADLSPLFRVHKHLEAFLSFRRQYDHAVQLEKVHAVDAWVMTQWHADYPKSLKNIKDPPICLYGKGDRQSIDFIHDTCVGIVGARRNTPYGKHVAEELGRSLARAGLIIVSGMATGIDTISHTAAMEEGGRTIAVLGTAIDIVYPYENKALHENILNEYGIIISEYPPGFVTSPGMFVLRNRIIVGLAKAIVVVEGGKHSGTLTTARYAAENGRDVYAVPGPVTSEMSVGPHILLREGAHVLTNAGELLTDFGLTHEYTSLTKDQIDLTDEERRIYDLLAVKKRYADEVARKMNLSVSETLPILSLLEVRGVIGKDMDGGFIVRV